MLQAAERAEVTAADFRVDPARPGSWIEERRETLRALPGRCVFRARAGGLDVVVKEYTPRRLRHRLRGYAEIEAARARAARERGVPVVDPVGWARLRDGRQIVVLREEKDARTLQSIVLEDAPRGGARHDLARRVGGLWAALHNAGIRSGDPHAGNVLVRPDGVPLFADAWDLRPGTYLRLDRRAKELADFSLFFLTHGTRSDLLLFWGAYGRASSFPPEELERLRRAVIARVPDAFLRLSRMRARKAMRMGRTFSAHGFTGLAFDGIPEATLADIAARAGRLAPGPDVLKKSPTGWTLAAAGDYVVKVTLPKTAGRPLRDVFRGTRAERAVSAAQSLERRGLRAPEIVAVLRDGPVPRRSVLVMKRVHDARPAGEALAAMTAPEARRAAVRLARTLRRMHDWGLRHRDLKQSNVLLDARGEPVFLDLDGVRETGAGEVDWERRARDLGNLSASLTDFRAVPTTLRLRALDAYLRGEIPPGHAPGEFARRVVGHARTFAERRAR